MRWWRFRYRVQGREKLISLGVYPEISLREARERRDEAKKMHKSGGDPSARRQIEQKVTAETFEAVAREWLAKFSVNWAPSHSEKVIRRIELDLFPWIGARPIREITAPELLTCLRRIEERGALDTAHRAHQNCGQVFRYAVATGRAERDPSADLRGALPPVKPGHFASITEPARVAALLRSIDSYDGSAITRAALRLAPLVFVRPGELRHAEWAEINFQTAEWRIPAEKMKARALHIVPLSRQALALFTGVQPLTGKWSRYVFPAAVTRTRPMSENTINSALRRMGYTSTDMTGHGFRSMASTLLNEQGWNRDAIERQLAHGERDPVRAAYNYAEHLPERRKMMQAWADFLDELRANVSSVQIEKVG